MVKTRPRAPRAGSTVSLTCGACGMRSVAPSARTSGFARWFSDLIAETATWNRCAIADSVSPRLTTYDVVGDVVVVVVASVLDGGVDELVVAAGRCDLWPEPLHAVNSTVHTTAMSHRMPLF